MSGAHLPGLALLDTLRPPAGWRVDRALLSTYSADPAVLAAVLLALAARDDDGGTGTKVGLARAMIELRDRVAFILQRGRIAAPRSGATHWGFWIASSARCDGMKGVETMLLAARGIRSSLSSASHQTMKDQRDGGSGLEAAI